MKYGRVLVATVLALLALAAYAVPAWGWSVALPRAVGPGGGVIEAPQGCPGMTVRADGIYNRTLVVHVAKDGTPTGLSGTLNAYGYFTNVGTGKTASVQEEGQYTAVVNPADLLHHFSETLSGRVDFFLVAGDVVTYQGQVLPAPGIYQITGRVTIDHTTDTGTAIGTKLIRFCDLLAAP